MEDDMSVTIEIPVGSYASLAAMLPPAHTVNVTVEDIGSDIGDQVAVDRLPLRSFSYDPDRHELDVTAGGRDRRDPPVSHRVTGPTGIWVEIHDGMVHSLAVESAGHRAIVTFHSRTALGRTRGAGAPIVHASESSPVELFG
jgi:hypothetical protein